MIQPDVSAALERNGFAVVPRVLTDEAVQSVIEALAMTSASPGAIRRGEVYALRALFDSSPPIRDIARSAALRGLVEPVLGSDAFAVKALLLDKTPSANWTVPWHQDLAIAVRERVEAQGYHGWSEKAGAPHVVPPPGVLENVLTVRIALDEGGVENGPLMVLPGSHVQGQLRDAGIHTSRKRVAPVRCPVPRGGALLMRPLLLHASRPAESPGRRRVLHIEYAAAPLPGGMEWRWRIEKAVAAR